VSTTKYNILMFLPKELFEQVLIHYFIIFICYPSIIYLSTINTNYQLITISYIYLSTSASESSSPSVSSDVSSENRNLDLHLHSQDARVQLIYTANGQSS
jgi:hypothetical protein